LWKKNKGDFTLWKTSKKDEPFWDHKEKNKSFNVLIESFWEFLLPLVPLLIMLSLMPKIKCLYIDIKEYYSSDKTENAGYWYYNGYIRETSSSIVYANICISL